MMRLLADQFPASFQCMHLTANCLTSMHVVQGTCTVNTASKAHGQKHKDKSSSSTCSITPKLHPPQTSNALDMLRTGDTDSACQTPYPEPMNKHNNMGFSMMHSCSLCSSVSLVGACFTDSCQLSRGSLPCHRLQHPLALCSQPERTSGDEKLTNIRINM